MSFYNVRKYFVYYIEIVAYLDCIDIKKNIYYLKIFCSLYRDPGRKLNAENIFSNCLSRSAPNTKILQREDTDTPSFIAYVSFAARYAPFPGFPI